MSKVLRTLGWIAFAALVLAASGVVYSTVTGRLVWYFRVDGVVTIDGQKSGGYLHTNTQRTILLITRTDGSRPETYLVIVQGRNTVKDCGDWHPVRLLPFAVGNANPLCAVATVNPGNVFDRPLNASAVTGRRSIEFATASGKKVKAEW